MLYVVVEELIPEMSQESTRMSARYFCGGIQRHDDARCGAGLTLLLERADGFVSAGYENARKDSEKYTIETGVGNR